MGHYIHAARCESTMVAIALIAFASCSERPKEKTVTADPPALIAINHDDYHAKHIGRTQDGRHLRVWYFDGARIP